MLAVARQMPWRPFGYALRSVAIALTTATYREISHRVAKAGRIVWRRFCSRRHRRRLFDQNRLVVLHFLRHFASHRCVFGALVIRIFPQLWRLRFSRLRSWRQRDPFGRVKGEHVIVSITSVYLVLGSIVTTRVTGVLRKVQPVEDDAHVSGCHPILKDGTIIEFRSTGTALQRTEGDTWRNSVTAVVAVRVGAQRLLLVGLGDSCAIWAAIDTSALTRVELERLPRFAIIHALIDGDRVGSWWLGAELQADVRDLVFLAKSQRQRHVVGWRIWWGAPLLRRHRVRAPAGDVARIVQISKVGSRETRTGLRFVAQATSATAFRIVAVATGAVSAARARRLYGRVERCKWNYSSIRYAY